MLIVYQIAKFVFRYIIPARWHYPLVRFIARIVIANNPARRGVIVGNLTPLIGKERAQALAPVLLGNFLMTAVDFFCPPRNLVRNVVLENWSTLERTYRKTRRMIAVTAHLGHWEMGISCLADKRFAIAGVYAPYRDDDIVRWIMSHRNPDVEWIPATRGAAEACIDALQKGRVVGIVGDIPFGEKGRRVMFDAGPAHLPLGPWAIAVRARATVVPAFIVRERPGHYRLTVHDPIVPGEGSFRRQMEQMQDAFKIHLESYLKKYPEQWGVLQPFWDTPL
jgi:KDO2-lipid IV(A) lauroyltransferase